MKCNYDREHDSLYIDLIDQPGADAREVADGVVLDFDEQGRLVGLDLDHASERVDLSRFETESVPVTDRA